MEPISELETVHVEAERDSRSAQRGTTYRRVVGSKADIGAFEVDADHIFGDALEPTPPLS